MIGWSIFLCSVIVMFVFVLKFMSNRVRVSSTNNCVMITGCDSGIGLTMALAAHSLGFHVIATCLNCESPGPKLLKEKCPDRMMTIQMDVRNPEQVKAAVDMVKAHLSSTNMGLWALVNNAGVLVYGQADWQTESQVTNQMEVNFVGVWRVSKAFLPLIRETKGRIINVTSTSGYWPLAGIPVYCGTKHAVEGFTHAFRAEMIPLGVKVILLNPGNFPANTQIMARQSACFEEMKQQFSTEDWSLYKDYFNCFKNHILSNFGSTPIKPLEEPGLIKIFESCLLLENPSHYYHNLNLGFRLFVQIFKILPAYWSDRLYLFLWGEQIGYKLLN